MPFGIGSMLRLSEVRRFDTAVTSSRRSDFFSRASVGTILCSGVESGSGPTYMSVTVTFGRMRETFARSLSSIGCVRERGPSPMSTTPPLPTAR